VQVSDPAILHQRLDPGGHQIDRTAITKKPGLSYAGRQTWNTTYGLNDELTVILDLCPTCSPYGDRRPYAVPDRLADLTGQASGRIVLPPELGWTGRTDYDLDDPADAAVLYERVLVDAVRTQDLTRLLIAGRLRLLWSRLFLPTRVRHLSVTRFPDLSAAA
jgi:hypothetical protein